MSRPALLRRGLCALGGMLAAMSFAWGQEGYAGMSELPASFDSYLWTALALVFAWLLWRTPRLRPADVALGLLFGVLNAFGGVLFAYVMNTWFGQNLDYAAIVLLGLVCSVIAQIGDLSFSVIKREYGIKDYGTIFPGHGGVLDRFDSVLFVSPAYYLIITAVMA